MTLLAILISTAVAVAVVFVLHSLDRENNSMNKVKHYADSRINQLDEYFKEQLEGESYNSMCDSSVASNWSLNKA